MCVCVESDNVSVASRQLFIQSDRRHKTSMSEIFRMRKGCTACCQCSRGRGGLGVQGHVETKVEQQQLKAALNFYKESLWQQ